MGNDAGGNSGGGNIKNHYLPENPATTGFSFARTNQVFGCKR